MKSATIAAIKFVRGKLQVCFDVKGEGLVIEQFRTGKPRSALLDIMSGSNSRRRRANGKKRSKKGGKRK